MPGKVVVELVVNMGRYIGQLIRWAQREFAKEPTISSLHSGENSYYEVLYVYSTINVAKLIKLEVFVEVVNAEIDNR